MTQVTPPPGVPGPSADVSTPLPTAPLPLAPPVPSRPTGRGRRRGPVALIAVLAVIAVVFDSAVLVAGVHGTLRAVQDLRDSNSRSPGTGTADRSAGPNWDSDVEKTLAAMNAEVDRGDAAGWAAGWAHAAPAVRTREAASFAGLRRLPSVVSYSWPDRSWHRLTGPANRYGNGTAAVALVRRDYQLTGYDRHPVAEQLGLTFVRDGEHWQLVGDTDLTGHQPPPEPWRSADISVVGTAHVLVIGDPGATAQLRRLASRVESAVGDVHAVWPTSSWNGRVVVYALSAKAFTQAWFGENAVADLPPATHAAEFDGEVVPIPAAGTSSPGSDWAGLRMVLAPRVLGYSTAEAKALLEHELTHVATLVPGSDPPVWLMEGIAEYTAYRKLDGSGQVSGVDALAARGLPRTLWTTLRHSSYRPQLVSSSRLFYEGSSAAVGTRYSDAWFAALYIADHYGEPTLRAFYRACVAPDQYSPAAAEANALHTVLHTDDVTFAAHVSSYARGLRKHFR